ncbi:MAG: N-acetylmuramoyl-L-alanine amidase family protein [Enterocloster sp.]
MKNVKRWFCMALTAATVAAALPVQTYASDYKYITSISLKLEVEAEAGDELDSGDSLGTSKDDSGTRVYTTSDKYDVASAEWYSDKEIGIGDTPKIIVWLEPNSSSDGEYDYKFRSSYSSSNVSVSGGEFVSASKSGSDLKVVIRTKGIKGTYEPPEDVEWGSGKGKATWEEPDDTSGYYDVYLYRGNSVVKKLEEYNGTSYNFYPYMTKEGDYSFKVRTVPHTDEQKQYGKKSEWAESDDKYIDEDEVSDGTGQSSDSSVSGGSTASGGTTDVGWMQDGDTWYFRYPDGTYQKNGWLKWNNKWYIFDSSGRMLTGWQQTGGKWYYIGPSGDMKVGWVQSGGMWYYMNPNQDGPEGAMVTSSWLTIDGKTYFLNENGVMAEGWTKVQDNWYYFYPGQGYKAVNTAISGFQLDADGVWQH